MVSIAFMLTTNAEAAKIYSPMVGIWQKLDDNGEINEQYFFKFTDSGELIRYKFKSYENNTRKVSKVYGVYELEGNVGFLEFNNGPEKFHVHFEGNDTMILIFSGKDESAVFKRAKAGELERLLRSVN